MTYLKNLKERVLKRPTRTTAEIVADILGTGSITVLDVGARWGTEDAWYRIPPLARVVGFEPDPEECARLNARAAPNGTERYVPLALGARTGRAALHVTKEPGCSSLYPPDPAVIARYPLLEVMTPQTTLDIELVRLDEWSRREGCGEISFIKLDVQGAELDVLEGADQVLESCVGLDLEVEFSPLYRGQPLFADVDRFLRERGFVLWRLSHLVHYAEYPIDRLERHEVAVYDNITTRTAAGNGRLSWGHALYFRDYAELPASPEGLRRRLILAALLDAAKDRSGLIACLRSALTMHRSELAPPIRARLASHLQEVGGAVLSRPSRPPSRDT